MWLNSGKKLPTDTFTLYLSDTLSYVTYRPIIPSFAPSLQPLRQFTTFLREMLCRRYSCCHLQDKQFSGHFFHKIERPGRRGFLCSLYGQEGWKSNWSKFQNRRRLGKPTVITQWVTEVSCCLLVSVLPWRKPKLLITQFLETVQWWTCLKPHVQTATQYTFLAFLQFSPA